MDLFRLWKVLRTHYPWIVLLTVVVMLGTYLTVRRLPKIYSAKAQVVVPQRPASSGGSLVPSLGRSDGLAGLVAGSLGLPTATTQDLFMAYLDSRTMAEDAVAHFDIQRRFNINEPQRAVAVVMGMRDFIPKKTGTIDIRVESPDPKFAADMANFYADNLDRMNRTYNTTDAGRYRRFIEGRLVETEKSLREAEERVRQFQERNKILVGASTDGNEGIKRPIDTLTRLQNTLLEEEIHLASLRVYATDENPDVILQKLRIQTIRNQLREVQYGDQGKPPRGRGKRENSDDSFTLPVAALPSTVLEGIRMQRDLKLQEAIFTLLSSQLEQAKIAEARDLPTLQILDRAIPPLYPIKPLVGRSVQFAGLLTFVAACLAAYAWDAIRRSGVWNAPGESKAG